MRWPPVIFTIGTWCAIGDVGDAAQLRRRGHAAVDARDHAEGAVALDVRVHAVVDEPRVALVLVVAGPDRLQQRGEAGLALRVLAPVGQRREHRRDAPQVAFADLGDQLRLAQRHAGHVVVRRRVVLDVVAGHRLEHLLHLRLARAAPGAGARRVAQRPQAAAAVGDRHPRAGPSSRRCSCRSARRLASRPPTRRLGAHQREQQLGAVLWQRHPSDRTPAGWRARRRGRPAGSRQPARRRARPSSCRRRATARSTAPPRRPAPPPCRPSSSDRRPSPSASWTRASRHTTPACRARTAARPAPAPAPRAAPPGRRPVRGAARTRRWRRSPCRWRTAGRRRRRCRARR